GQPLAGAISTVGINVCFGGGKVGSGPMPADTGSLATSPQALVRRANRAGKNWWCGIIWASFLFRVLSVSCPLLFRILCYFVSFPFRAVFDDTIRGCSLDVQPIP